MKFPYNTEDRIEFLNKKIRLLFNESQNIEITQNKNNIILISAKISEIQHSDLLKLGATYNKKTDKYVFEIN